MVMATATTTQSVRSKPLWANLWALSSRPFKQIWKRAAKVIVARSSLELKLLLSQTKLPKCLCVYKAQTILQAAAWACAQRDNNMCAKSKRKCQGPVILWQPYRGQEHSTRLIWTWQSKFSHWLSSAMLTRVRGSNLFYQVVINRSNSTRQ